MQLHDFVREVQQQAQLDSREAAMRAIQATFETLSDRLIGNEPKHLAAQLPAPISDYLRRDGKGERFSPQEFCHRVAEREGVDEDLARNHAHIVLRTLSAAVNDGEVEDMLQQLPQDYRPLFGSGGVSAPPKFW